MKKIALMWRMNAYGSRKVLIMDSQGSDGSSAGWILRLKIDLEWEEGSFPSRTEAELYYEQLVKDYGTRIGSAELITPKGDTEQLTRSGSQPGIQ
jgi:hypothetical protein